MLTKLHNIPLHKLHSAQEWDEIFALFGEAIGSEQPQVRETAIERAATAIGAEGAQAYRQGGFTPKPLRQRLAPLLEAVVAQEGQTVGCVESFCHYVALNLLDEEPYRSLMLQWLDALADAQSISETTFLSCKTRLKGFGDTWEAARKILLLHLDHDELVIRAAAAQQLGRLYVDDDPSQSLAEMMSLIKQKEIERPGVAGPFFGAVYFEFDFIQEQYNSSIDPVEWTLDILAHRQGDEPDFKYFNGLDFYAHELCGGQAGLIRRLLDLGKTDIAIEAATEWRDRIEEVEPILMELGHHPDPEIAGRAAWHLAYHYHCLHPRGAELGVVELISDLTQVDIFLNYMPKSGEYPYSAVIYPKNDSDLLSDESAWQWVNTVIPPHIRGELAPNVLRPDGPTGPVTLGDKTGYTFSHGALIEFRGDHERKQWQTVTIIWHGAENFWNAKGFIETRWRK